MSECRLPPELSAPVDDVRRHRDDLLGTSIAVSADAGALREDATARARPEDSDGSTVGEPPEPTAVPRFVEQRPRRRVGAVEGHAPCRRGLALTGVLQQQLGPVIRQLRSEEHTSELQSLMRISYAVFCFKKKTINHTH